MRFTITARTLGSILEAAGMWIDPDGDLDDTAVGFRPSYRGRGYAPDGFGLVFHSHSELAAFLVAVGMHCADSDNDPDSLDGLTMARATQTDSMGLHMIAYWPGWKVEGNIYEV